MIIKWPGGKKWLYKKHNQFFPISYNNFIEPFFGSGSVFFSIHPKKAIISDTNQRLIYLFIALKENPKNLFYETSKLLETHNSEQYYDVRKIFNNADFAKPHHFLYLNRTCFNGVYRENQKGEFNVPVGDRQSFPFELGNFLEYSMILKNAELTCSDYLDSLKKAKKGDFIYLDPPYIKKENNYDSFRKYNKDVFNEKNLKELAVRANELKDKCKILISNFDVSYVEELFPDWNYEKIQQRSYISGKKEGRRLVDEALIYNYDLCFHYF